MRYGTVGGQLGSGEFGTVHKAIDVDRGKFVAVKILKRPTRASKQEGWLQSLYYALKRAETRSGINHPYIVDFITSQGRDGPNVEIFIGLKEETLESLDEDVGEFRRRSNRFKTIAEVQWAVLSTTPNIDSVSRIREMAIINPEEGASAEQILVKYLME
ncbi:hypothetical protein BJ875DRAFT_511689 [Amylocarpus encephaloides]|uniref:Protein kinase domain-containing protein n=1 Tax=Amylocarpus encephaloides TaxID=45428 RepID=A0A9P7YRS5_9HELO|nr:hypothetical protein BJ875DRAFT_511689 [Amylocarpus encephaloides]